MNKNTYKIIHTIMSDRQKAFYYGKGINYYIDTCELAGITAIEYALKTGIAEASDDWVASYVVYDYMLSESEIISNADELIAKTYE